MIEKKSTPIYLYFIIVLIIITLGLIVLRILLYFYSIISYVDDNKDIDYLILIEGMKNGLIHFYDSVKISKWPPYYLYFWYFLFFPMYLLPVEVGLYVWDILRLLSVSYVFIKARAVFKNTFDLIIFYLTCSVGYIYDAFFNNVNFLIFLFVFLSYKFLEEDKKWIAGIFFTLSTFKINSLIFLPLLLIIRKIKLKDLTYFLVPFFLICIPYMLFPNYFMQMLNNWGHNDEDVQGLLVTDSITWKALQPTHLMLIGFLIFIFLENLENISMEKKKNFFRIMLPTMIGMYYLYLTIIVFIPQIQ